MGMVTVQLLLTFCMHVCMRRTRGDPYVVGALFAMVVREIPMSWVHCLPWLYERSLCRVCTVCHGCMRDSYVVCALFAMVVREIPMSWVHCLPWLYERSPCRGCTVCHGCMRDPYAVCAVTCSHKASDMTAINNTSYP